MSPSPPDEGRLLFVIPVVSPRLARSWEHVQRLLGRTLHSICAQTSPRFEVVVVCHERPRTGFEHPAVRYLEADLPVPEDEYDAKSHDKRVKTRLGIHHGRDLGATHSMAVDADDFVSRRLAAHVARHPTADGWFFPNGYFYREGDRKLHLRRRDYYRWTGTSQIVRQDLFPIPEGLAPRDFDRPETLGETYYVSARRAREEVAQRGGELRPLPFPGSVYVVDHGENMGSVREEMYRPPGLPQRIKRAIFNDIRLTPRLRQEFSLCELDAVPPPSS